MSMAVSVILDMFVSCNLFQTKQRSEINLDTLTFSSLFASSSTLSCKTTISTHFIVAIFNILSTVCILFLEVRAFGSDSSY